MINLVTVKNIKWSIRMVMAALLLRGLACINRALSEMPDVESAVEIRLLNQATGGRGDKPSSIIPLFGQAQ